MTGKKAVIIFNPGSGKGLGASRAEAFLREWEARFPSVPLRMRPTRSKEDIRVAAKETRSDEGEIAFFMGGDGTLSEGLQGLAERHDFDLGAQPPVGFIPGGTGNSFLRDFGIESHEAGRDALMEAWTEAASLEVDAGIVTYGIGKATVSGESDERVRRLMFNIFGIGLISDITEMAVGMRHLGAANYQVATLAKVLRHRPYHYRMTIDGEREDQDVNLVTVSNSRFTGGAMEIAPEVRINDGKLFLVMIQAPHRLSLIRLFPKVLKGDYAGESRVQARFIKTLSLEQDQPFLMNIDGELEEGFDPEIRIHPSFFRLLMPRARKEPLLATSS